MNGVTNKKKILSYLTLTIVSALTAFPVIWMILMSVRPNVEVFSIPPTIIPRKFTLQAYTQVLSNSTYMRFFLNSYIVGLMVTLVSIIVATFAGYGFSRFKFQGGRLMNVFIVSTQMVPPITLLIPYFAMIVKVNLYDTYGGLIVTYASFSLPYAILMMTAYFNTIPKELDEAAIVDGASRFRVLRSIVFPAAVPGIIATGVYTFLLAWNEFLFALTLTRSTNMRTVPVGISMLMGEHAYNWNTMLSISMLGSIPVLLMFVITQKYFISGLAAGAVKG